MTCFLWMAAISPADSKMYQVSKACATEPAHPQGKRMDIRQVCSILTGGMPVRLIAGYKAPPVMWKK